MTSLEAKINAAGGAVNMMRNARGGGFPFPIRSEYTNWRDEQESWRKTAVLFDQSHHMTELRVKGKDAYRLVSDIGVNTFKGFGPMKAKQLVAVNHYGNMIGDAILFCLGENHINIVGRPPVLNWAEFNAKTGGYDVTLERDERTVQNKTGRDFYRFQIQGPTAGHIFEKVNGGPLDDIPFFGMGRFKIGKHVSTALNHRMSGFPGLEFWGPMSEHDSVLETLLEAGAEFGLTQAGSRTYSSVATESGWIASTMPAVYTGDKMKPYREWQKGASFEGFLGLGGSFASDNIEDYYHTPWDLGYGHIIKHDHDFIGADALKERAGEKHRKKVWLYWERDDVAKIFASMYEQGDKRFKYIDTPSAFYSQLPFDRVETDEGKMIGVSTLSIYSSNVRGWISICTLDEDEIEHGKEVNLIWGEAKGYTKNILVEEHTQTTIRAKIGPRPFSQK
ncbi:MAG: aminomethyl transferase family protein [Qingshengfaniella sp.]